MNARKPEILNILKTETKFVLLIKLATTVKCTLASIKYATR